MIRRIVLGLNGTHPAKALPPFVVGLAKRLGASLTLAYAVNVRAGAASRLPAGVGADTRDEEVRANAYLSEIAGSLQESGVIATTYILFGEPAAELIAIAEQTGGDVIAVASHGRSGFHHLARTCVAETLLKTALRPVLLLPSSEHEPLEREIRQIVVPLDGSPAAETVLSFAGDLARNLGVPLVLFRSAERTPPAAANMTEEDETALLAALRRGTEAYLEQVATELRHHEELEEAPIREAEAYLEQIAAGLKTSGPHVSIAVAAGHPGAALEDYTWSHPESLVVMQTTEHVGEAEPLRESKMHLDVEYLGAPALIMRTKGQLSYGTR